jgi:hypothetical protein
MSASRHDLHTLAGPYALDAVSDADRAGFAEHLAECEPCREDVREMREAAARLGLAVSVMPRPDLREQTLRAAFASPQLAPVVPVAVPGPAGLLAGNDSVSDAQGSPGRPAGPTAPEPGDGAVRGAAGWRRLRGRAGLMRPPERVSLAAAAALAAVAAVLGGVTSNAMRQLDRSRQQDQLIAAVLSAPDRVLVTAPVMTGGTATLIMSHQAGAAVFTAHGLIRLPSTEGYEIWLMGPTGDRSAGMVTPQAGGMAGPEVVRGLRPGDTVGVTVEPAGGTSRPTSVPVVVFKPRP